MGYEDKGALFKSLVQAFVPVSSTNWKKEAEQHFVDLVGKLILLVSPFLFPTGNFKQWSKWKGGCGSAEFTIHISVQCCEVWTCLAWGDELNCFNKRIVGQWQEPLRQTRNWDQESKEGSAVGDQECLIRHRSMREYPGSLIKVVRFWGKKGSEIAIFRQWVLTGGQDIGGFFKVLYFPLLPVAEFG